jgi:hypothetical protein
MSDAACLRISAKSLQSSALLYLSVPDVGALFPPEVGYLHRRTRRPRLDRSPPDARLLCFAICING